MLGLVFRFILIIINAISPRVLIFGDSLSKAGSDWSYPIQYITLNDNNQEQPGAILGYELAKRGYRVMEDCNVGRSAYNYFRNTSKYQKVPAALLIEEDKAFDPDLVIIFLGLNDIGIDWSQDQEAFKKLHDTFYYSKIIIIGPPSVYGLNDQIDIIYDTINSIFANVIDIRDVTSSMARTKDGQHFTVRSARQLADHLLKEVTQD
jgi:lysophospholipase L1-like esterase